MTTYISHLFISSFIIVGVFFSLVFLRCQISFIFLFGDYILYKEDNCQRLLFGQIHTITFMTLKKYPERVEYPYEDFCLYISPHLHLVINISLCKPYFRVLAPPWQV